MCHDTSRGTVEFCVIKYQLQSSRSMGRSTYDESVTDSVEGCKTQGMFAYRLDSPLGAL